ncbi:MAG TPA: hypothetical protein VF011_02800 [Terriglobales bacterium]
MTEPTFKKVPATSVRYGEDIAQHRAYVWVALEGEQVVCVASTSKEVRELYKRVKLGSAYGRAPAVYPTEQQIKGE